MLMYNNSMDKNMGAFRKGFTIIEVMLFLALSGLLLVGILGGLGDNIARQRYNDAVQDVVNILRDQYSFVADTQITVREADTSCYGLVSSDIEGGEPTDYFRLKNLSAPDSMSHRGRTNCVVYGAVVTIGENRMETTELLGKDYLTVNRELPNGIPANATELEVLGKYVKANNLSFNCTSGYTACYIHTAGRVIKQNTKWGTRMLDVEGNPLQKTLLIFRSPRDGSIRTYVMDGLVTVNQTPVDYYTQVNNANSGQGISATDKQAIDRYGINQFLRVDEPGKMGFKVADLDICLDSGDGQTYNNARRLIKVRSGAMGQSDVELMNLDSEKDATEGTTSGVTSCN